jgi:hypothetical protein
MTDRDTIEAFIDRHGLPAVLDMIAAICGDKAEHVAVNWQDSVTAKTWARDATLIAKMAESVETAFN